MKRRSSANPFIRYRKLKKWKYQLYSTYHVEIDDMGLPLVRSEEINTDYATLRVMDSTGRLFLTIREGYCWDGPSGPAIDTPNFMRGSLLHDVFYQMMRLGYLDHKLCRKPADDLLRRVCREDGMCSLRAWWVYTFVRWFGGGSAAPNPYSEPPVINAP